MLLYVFHDSKACLKTTNRVYCHKKLRAEGIFIKNVGIIGGGASGLCAAIEALNTGAAVIVYERLPRVGKKILSTGNGRCNLSNTHIDADCYRGDKTLVNAVLKSRFADTEGFFNSLGVLLTEEDGRLYPRSQSAASVIDALRFAATSLGCRFETDTPITDIRQLKDAFLLNNTFHADAVILACGGAASPDLGSDGSGFALLESLGHTVNAVRPALVSLCCADSYFKSLKGIRAKGGAILLCEGNTVGSDYGEIQFTEYGLSGIPIFNLSRFIDEKSNHRYVIHLDLCTDIPSSDLETFLLSFAAIGTIPTAADVLSGLLPKRLGEAVLKRCGISPADTPMVLAEKAPEIAAAIKSFAAQVNRTSGFRAAQVTAGGLSSKEINPVTLESKKVPKLYVCGELLDVDGICGGYNLHLAWTTGRTAGYNAAK